MIVWKTYCFAGLSHSTHLTAADQEAARWHAWGIFLGYFR
jgi:hypothetical protein